LDLAMPLLDREARAECLRQVGAAALRLDEVERGLRALDSAARIAPESLQAQLDYARGLATHGSAQDARAVYDRILNTFEFDAENRARIESERAQVEMAEPA